MSRTNATGHSRSREHFQAGYDAPSSFLSKAGRLQSPAVLLLLDIGNTHTHVALAEGDVIQRARNFSTGEWASGKMSRRILRHVGNRPVTDVALCSVVPRATTNAIHFAERTLKKSPFQLDSKTVRGIGIEYPKATTIGADRLANAVAARRMFGTPVVVVDFGTAVTFDVVNRVGNYVGGIIAPGLEVMTSYLHEKTALLPHIKIREVTAIVGKSTEQAMLIGAVHGYRGLIHELIQKLKEELKTRRLPVVATGGYAELMAKGLPEIDAIEPLLTLKGLCLAWQLSRDQSA